MNLILKGGAVFLHIPETGDNWVNTTLKKAGLVLGSFSTKHATMDRLFGPKNQANEGALARWRGA